MPSSCRVQTWALENSCSNLVSQVDGHFVELPEAYLHQAVAVLKQPLEVLFPDPIDVPDASAADQPKALEDAPDETGDREVPKKMRLERTFVPEIDTDHVKMDVRNYFISIGLRVLKALSQAMQPMPKLDKSSSKLQRLKMQFISPQVWHVCPLVTHAGNTKLPTAQNHCMEN
eukprot:3867352-Amphidinium_carterae.1